VISLERGKRAGLWLRETEHIVVIYDTAIL